MEPSRIHRPRTARGSLAALAAIVITAILLVSAPTVAANDATADPGAQAANAAQPADFGAAAFDPNPTLGGNGKPVPAPHYATGPRGVYAPSYLPACPYQRVCVAVIDYQDANINTWKIWDLYRCGNYSLYNWYGRGWVRNNQSGGATLVRLDSNHFPILPVYGVNNSWRDIDWQPAWHIETCR